MKGHFREADTGDFGLVDAGTGANSKGAKFLNFYHFSPCRDRLVLVEIDENAQ